MEADGNLTRDFWSYEETTRMNLDILGSSITYSFLLSFSVMETAKRIGGT